MDKAEILEEISAQMQPLREFLGATFEMLEDYWAIGDAQLSALRAQNMWVVAIEVAGYDARADEFELRVWLFGNCLTGLSEWAFHDFSRPLFNTPNAWNLEIEPNQVWGFAREQFSIQWRGKRFDFSPSLEELRAAKLELSRPEIASGQLSPIQMLRYVAEKLDHPFFLSDDALRDLIDKHALPFEWKYDKETERSWYENECGEWDKPPIPSVILERIVHTRDWRHPRVDGPDYAEDEWAIPPEAAFEPLAEALACGDLTAWSAQNPALSNSHWSNWAQTEAANEQVFDEHRAALIAEGQRFQASLSFLSEPEKTEMVNQLRASWQQLKAEIEAMPLFPGVSYSTSGGAFDFDGQTWSFGPHLWGEVDGQPQLRWADPNEDLTDPK